MAFESPVFVSVELERGDSYTGRGTVRIDGAAADLTTVDDLVWAVKENERDADAAAVVVKRLSLAGMSVDAVDLSLCYVYLAPWETLLFAPGHRYVWSLRVLDEAGALVATPFRGELVANRQILRVG